MGRKNTDIYSEVLAYGVEVELILTDLLLYGILLGVIGASRSGKLFVDDDDDDKINYPGIIMYMLYIPTAFQGYKRSLIPTTFVCITVL